MALADIAIHRSLWYHSDYTIGTYSNYSDSVIPQRTVDRTVRLSSNIDDPLKASTSTSVPSLSIEYPSAIGFTRRILNETRPFSNIAINDDSLKDEISFTGNRIQNRLI